MKSHIGLLAILLIAAITIFYFVGLNYSPAPFFLDESLVQAEVIKKAWLDGGGNNHWIIIQHGNMDGYFSYGPYVFIASILAKFNGVSVYGSRLPGTLFALLTGLLIYWLLRTFGVSREYSLLGPVFYLLMPAVIVQSRVAWDPSMYPLVCAGAAFAAERGFSRIQKGKLGHRNDVFVAFGVTGLLTGLVCWVYPAGRLTGAIFALFCCARITVLFATNSGGTRKERGNGALAALCGVATGLFPIMLILLNEISRTESSLSRTNSELILGLDNILTRIAHNYALNIFDLSYLIFRGDPNLRHSLGFFGAIGPAGIAILFMALTSFFYRGKRGSCSQETDMVSPNKTKVILFLYIAIYTLPAALSITSPHALRASGSFPFWASLAAVAVAELFSTFNRRIIFCALAAVLSYSLVAISSYALGGLRLQGYKQLSEPLGTVSSYPGSSRGHFGYSEYMQSNRLSDSQICSLSRKYYDPKKNFSLFPDADSVDAARTLYIAHTRGIFKSCFKIDS